MSHPHSPAIDAINAYYNGEEERPLEEIVDEYEQLLAHIIGEAMEEYVPMWVWPILDAYLKREPLDFGGLTVPLPVQEFLVAEFLDDLGIA